MGSDQNENLYCPTLSVVTKTSVERRRYTFMVMQVTRSIRYCFYLRFWIRSIYYNYYYYFMITTYQHDKPQEFGRVSERHIQREIQTL